jgi:hypothetical protein
MALGADFYVELFAKLQNPGVLVHINQRPNEIPDAIPFSQDRVHSAYDPLYAQSFWRLLL